jgi:hypothetical protein
VDPNKGPGLIASLRMQNTAIDKSSQAECSCSGFACNVGSITTDYNWSGSEMECYVLNDDGVNGSIYHVTTNQVIYACEGGEFGDYTLTEGSSCGVNKFCSGGTCSDVCVVNGLGEGASCGDGLSCKNGSCVNANAGVACLPDDSMDFDCWVDGVYSDTGVCINGRAVDGVDASCSSSGYSCNNGVKVGLPALAEGGDCGNGRSCVSGSCEGPVLTYEPTGSRFDPQCRAYGSVYCDVGGSRVDAIDECSELFDNTRYEYGRWWPYGSVPALYSEKGTEQECCDFYGMYCPNKWLGGASHASVIYSNNSNGAGCKSGSMRVVNTSNDSNYSADYSGFCN